MLISLEKKFLFIHVYKVAGTSITKSLSKYQYQPETAFINRLINKTLNKALSKKIVIDPQGIYPLIKKNSPHLKAYEVQEKIPKTFEKTYKFAFVRNPWEWQVSLYHYMLKNENHHFHEKMKQLGSFRNYLKWLINEHSFSLQSSFLLNKDETKLLVDYVGRLETIEEDFRLLCEKLSLNAKLPHYNTSNHKRYTDYYDQETFQWISNSFKKDIDLLGYSFDSYEKTAVHQLINSRLDNHKSSFGTKNKYQNS